MNTGDNGQFVQTPLPPTALSPLETAIWHTLAYGDIFDYPLTAPEIHRYLEGSAASFSEVEASLASGTLLSKHLHHSGGYYAFQGREEIVATRQARSTIARRFWPAAVKYGRLIAHLPFVRMVAVTGSLTMNNVDETADIDYLVVTDNGRVWLSRLFIIAIVNIAFKEGYTLCPNYILAERALLFSDQNLYTAREVTQMIPLSGMATYKKIRKINDWTDALLPNAAGPPRDMSSSFIHRPLIQNSIELVLRTPAGRWLDQWEMKRKIHKFRQQFSDQGEAQFSADWCKGHFHAHSQESLTAYRSRLGKA